MPLDSASASTILIDATATAVSEINSFASVVFRTRGGRLGSGMGTLLEALWGYYTNQQLHTRPEGPAPCEIAWLSDHEYNDFALVHLDATWDPASRTGELLRIEAKSMNAQVDESKGHFDELVGHLDINDLLLVLVWSWDAADAIRVSPRIRDYFIAPARPVAELRDKLHLARGGSFVTAGACPDRCRQSNCSHIGEPLNASGKRERLSGPLAAKPSGVSYAANFGGLVRMLKTSSESARTVFREARRGSSVAHQYISFIHRNFPSEERNQFLRTEWHTLARQVGIRDIPNSVEAIQLLVRETAPDYQERLRLFT